MRYVLVLTMAAAVAACAPRPKFPPPTPAQEAQRMCSEIGQRPGSPEHAACAERMLAKMLDGDALARAAEAGRPRPVFVPQMPYLPPAQPMPAFQPPPRFQTTCTRLGNMTTCN